MLVEQEGLKLMQYIVFVEKVDLILVFNIVLSEAGETYGIEGGDNESRVGYDTSVIQA